jgi:predicted Zn-dependent protease
MVLSLPIDNQTAAHMKQLIVICSIIASYFLIESCAKNPVTGKSQVVFMSEAQEIAMGNEADPQIIAQYGLYGDSLIQRFINEKGKQMAAISHRPNLEYHFRVVDSEVLNAFAVPGGYVYFTRGIMAHFNNEAEFAGVLGHEIGHIAARHSVIQQRNQVLGQVGIIAGVIINPDLGKFAEVASQGLGLLFLKFGRDDERQADVLGVEYSSKINYDAHQMANFFITLQRQGQQTGSSELPDFLSTHPNPGDRHIATDKLATEWQTKLNLKDPKVNRNEYLRRIEGLIYGEDPAQGFLENNVFYHPGLKLQFPVPDGWMYQNTPQMVQLAPKDGKALLMFMMGKGNTLQEAANNAVQQYKLQVVESRSVTVNGMQAWYMVADQVAEQSTIRTLSYFILYNNVIYHFIGVSSINDFNNYTFQFNSIAQNFKVLTDPAKLNKKADRIRIRIVSANTTLGQALKDLNMPQARMEELAILNGMKLTDNITKGTLIKVITQ